MPRPRSLELDLADLDAGLARALDPSALDVGRGGDPEGEATRRALEAVKADAAMRRLDSGLGRALDPAALSVGEADPDFGSDADYADAYGEDMTDGQRARAAAARNIKDPTYLRVSEPKGRY